MFDFTAHGFEELDANLGARPVVFYEEHNWLLGSPQGRRLVHRFRRARRAIHLVGCSRLRRVLLLVVVVQGARTALVRHGVRDLVDVIRVERVDADGLPYRIYGISAYIIHGVMHHGHRYGRYHGCRVGRGFVNVVQALKLTIGYGVGRDTG